MKVAVFLTTVAALFAAGCGKPSTPVEIASEQQETGEAPEVITSAQRFGYSQAVPEGSASSAGQPAGAPTAPSAQSDLHWSAPEGWTQGPARTMREVTYFLDDAQSAECYVTVLPGAAGGVAANLNRWCGQMGSDPLDDAALAALPKIQCLGAEAPLLVLEGTFRGMGGKEQTDNLFAGTVAQHAGSTVFVKMVGPKTLVAPQVDAFKAFCASLHDGRGHTHE